MKLKTAKKYFFQGVAAFDRGEDWCPHVCGTVEWEWWWEGHQTRATGQILPWKWG